MQSKHLVSIAEMEQKVIKTYSELILLPTFEERFQYLKIEGVVGRETFGHNRYLNQILYNSPEWRHFRNGVIVRDNGCDLGCSDHSIPKGVPIYIHHINPITVKDILERNPIVFDMENVISTIFNTHQAIHYSDENLLVTGPIERTANDTCPWRH